MIRRPRIWLALVLVVALLPPALAQNPNDDPELRYFYGGKLTIDASFASQMISGSGINGVVTSSAASSRPDPFVVFGNPANMRHIQDKVAFGITFQPRLSMDMPTGLQDAVDESMDTFTEEFYRPDPDAIVYPEAGGTVGRSPSALSSFGMAIPAGKWRVGLGYTRPFYLDADINLGGFSQRIDQPEDDPAEEISFAIQTRMGLSILARADRWNVGVSREVGRWSFGFSLARTYMEIDFNGGYSVDGIMTRGTQQYAFNDPSDPWYNEFAGHMVGGYTGTMYTYRIGAVHLLGGREETSWRVGLDVAINSGNTLYGGLNMAVDEFLAMELEPEEGEDSFDVNRIEDVTEITRTYNNQYFASDEMTFEVPSHFALSFAKPGGWRPNLTFKYFFGGDFGYSLDVTEKRVTDEEYATNTYARGLTPKYEFYLGVNPGWFFMGFGAMFVSDVAEGYVDGNGVDIVDENDTVLPRFDLGVSFQLSEHLRYEMLLAGLPEDALRMGVVYEF